MGFKSVYRCLQEIFPEIDARILRAVAIEHSKDADAAVNDVLNEVIPNMTVRSNYGASSTPNEKNETLLPRCPADGEASAEPSLRSGFTVGESSNDGAYRNGSAHACNGHLDEADKVGASLEPECSAVGNCVTADCTTSVLYSDLPDCDEVVYAGISPELSTGSKIADSHLSTNGSFHAVAATTGCEEPANELELLNFSDDGDSNLVTEIMNEGLILEEQCERKNDMELSHSVNALSNALEKKEVKDKNHITTESDSFVSSDKIDAIIDHDQAPSGMPPVSTNDKDGSTGRLTEPDQDFNCSVGNESLVSDEKSFNVDYYIEDTLLEPSNIVAELVSPSVIVETADATECDLLAELCCDHPAAGSLNISDESVVSDEKSFNINDFMEDILLKPSNIVSVETADATECDLQSELCCDHPAAGSLKNSSKNDYSFIEMGSNDDAFARNGKQSSQICSTDFLDEIIEGAKSNKKNLFSVMESVMNMIKEVELQERAADQAKEEAAMGGIDILVKVEEMKQTLAHAQEANGMHAGEVYGERSILATEVRELQSRLLCLSDERDKSLATLDEMRKTLEARLAAAEEMKKAAEEEKLRKEESARKALSEQEAIMEKVVQESKLLEQEAAENSKLQDFLVDRGRIVDILQGEISVICQDVKLLKEKFDKRVPLNMSVSSSQTTCKLASSGSSQKSVASVLAYEEPESCKTLEEGGPDLLIGDALKLHAEEGSVKADDEKGIEDEWDILDKDEGTGQVDATFTRMRQ